MMSKKYFFFENLVALVYTSEDELHYTTFFFLKDKMEFCPSALSSVVI